MAAPISKEAKLSEVLAEVSVLDVGLILKQAFIGLGCLAILILVGVVLEAGANYAMPGFHVPSSLTWLFWLVVVWGWLHDFTSNKSYHHWEFGWYFPKLYWWGSLLFAAYIFGGIKLYLISGGISEGATRTIVGVGIWLYLMPFILFLSVLEIGHSKLMQKREAAATSLSAGGDM